MDYKKLADILLDSMTEWRGVQDTILCLIDWNYTKEELIELGFSEEDIDYASNYYNKNFRN